MGLLAPMPILERHLMWSMDFILGLTLCTGLNTIYTCIKKLSKFVHVISFFKGEGELSAPEYAILFFPNIFHLFSLPQMV